MYNVKDIQFVGRHDYDKESAKKFASWNGESFSIGIFRWELKSNGKEMKRSKCIVRVVGSPSRFDKVIEKAEYVTCLLDSGTWDGRKNIVVK